MILFLVRRYDSAFVFLISAFFLSLLQLSPSFPDPDSFYHARMALEMTRGPVLSFSALPDTILSTAFTDHHFLYHIFLIPFVAFTDPLIGIKIATVFFASLFLSFFYWLLKKSGASHGTALFFLLLLAVNSVFLFRLNLAKIPAVSLIVFFAGLQAVMRERIGALFGLSFLYVWLYGGWPLLPASAGLAWLIRALVHQRSGDEKDKFQISNFKFHIKECWLRVTRYTLHVTKALCSWNNLKLPAIAFSGALAGLLINPYFPTNLTFYWIQTFKIAVLNILTEVPVGGEWYSAGATFVPAHGPTLMLLVFSLSAFVFPGLFAAVFRMAPARERTNAQWLLFVLTLGFLALTLRSQRYGEYFAPTATLFSSVVLAPFFSKELCVRVWRYVKNVFVNLRTLRGAITLYFCAVAPMIIFLNISSVALAYRDGYRFSQYANGFQWLKKNIPEGSRIFHNRWDDFPLFYYRAPGYRYVSGLDPRFLYEQNSEQAGRYTTFSTGGDLSETFGYRALCTAAQSSIAKDNESPKLFFACTPHVEKEKTAELIASFQPSAIVITHLDQGLQEKILGIPGWKQAYRDDELVIFMYDKNN